MKNKKTWTIVIILTATAGFIALQNGLAPTPSAATQTAAAANAAPTASNEGCGYMWAYHDAPELTDKVSAMILNLDAQANAHASLYGEDCIYADGHADFHVMETDFYVRLPVDDLTNEKFFGDWMAQVMPLIAQIPRKEIQGNYGFVEFWFEKNETEHAGVRVPIQIYMDQAQGKSGIELYKMFSVTP
ncbi:MAG: hypothetical protein PHQ36_05495 [Anaerolineales bacterium]|nr:hypothetical protein [Anaerolineales bacterium]